ncbi:hypothetical protein [Priestia megaterium]|uniref:hypothetical protein n=1 Tax=Priestia megaterium TaxID=1404 RepID=UPI000BF4B6CD|nr:hypothetical protein [Priestia megaterium]PFR93557.1 hypothetical protein COK39_17875 [Priestia megaterium]
MGKTVSKQTEILAATISVIDKTGLSARQYINSNGDIEIKKLVTDLKDRNILNQDQIDALLNPFS